MFFGLLPPYYINLFYLGRLQIKLFFNHCFNISRGNFILSKLKFNYLSSVFTREKGFTKLKSSIKFPRKKAVNILNSFTPQGSSPQGSIRITSVNGYLGVGYYKMVSPSIATLSTYLLDSSAVGLNPFTPPLISNPDKINVESVNPWVNLSYPSDWIYPVVNKFGTLNTSTLLFSFLSGDNILIVHPDQEVRLRFLGFFLNLIPSVALKYNRITFGCSELDGNENIVGIDQLPLKYRSHKKLYLPLDTIFVDLTNHNIEGEGIKRSPFTDNLSRQINSNYSYAKEQLNSLFTEIITKTQNSIFENNDKDLQLKDRIEIKLKLKTETKQQDWLMF